MEQRHVVSLYNYGYNNIIFQYLFSAGIRLQVTKELNPRHQRKGVLFPCIKRGAAMNLASGLWDLKRLFLVGWKVRLIENGMVERKYKID